VTRLLTVNREQDFAADALISIVPMVGTENTIWDGEYHLPKKEFPEGNTNTVRQYIEPSLRAGIAYRSPSDTFRRRETLLVVPNFVERYQ